jgi:hypothetical protein
MAFRYKGTGYKMGSPLKYMDPPEGEDNQNSSYSNPGRYASEKGSKYESSPMINDRLKGSGSKGSDNGSYSSYESYDKETGYFNPWEVLAKNVLYPDTKRAQERVTKRQETRMSNLKKDNASPEKIARVKTRQESERTRRFGNTENKTKTDEKK